MKLLRFKNHYIEQLLSIQLLLLPEKCSGSSFHNAAVLLVQFYQPFLHENLVFYLSAKKERRETLYKISAQENAPNYLSPSTNPFRGNRLEGEDGGDRKPDY